MKTKIYLLSLATADIRRRTSSTRQVGADSRPRLRLKGLFMLLILLSSFVLHPSALRGASLGTAFTYQGQLRDAGQPANGIYNLRFTIHDALTEGSTIGGILTNAATPVANGLFTATLDFGPGVFTGDARWLEIGVRTNGSLDDFTTLSPRQALTSTPYAMLAGNVPAGAIGNAQLAPGAVNASNIMSGTITAQQLAANSAFSNLYAGGQSGVASGGVVLSEDANNQSLVGAGYVKIGKVELIAEHWNTNYLDGPPDTANFAASRYGHSAVWTGTEMLVWGGYNAGELDDGLRYNPTLNTWAVMSKANPPSPRLNHTAVWSGSQMVVWGGYYHGDSPAGGGRYNPASDTWSSMNTDNEPTPRTGHAAVWASNVGRMLVWGGNPGSSVATFADGGRYNPVSDTWTNMSNSGAPSKRMDHSFVWTGTQLIVWGGYYYYDCGYTWCASLLDTGGRYSPTTDSWTAINNTGAPAERYGAKAVWTGSQMLVWGGSTHGGPTNTGGRYTPGTDSWTTMSTVNAPDGRWQHTAVWDGNRMIVWGGLAGSSCFNTGGRYDPSANTWATVSTVGAPSARTGHTAVWTGSRIVVWGGHGIDYQEYDSGGRYDVTNNTWSITADPAASGELGARQDAAVVWTGSEMIVWGGQNHGVRLRSGGRFNPALNTWNLLPLPGAPSARIDHTAVWTGTDMLVWGGFDGNPCNTGSAYQPATDAWRSIPTTNAPARRRGHSAVWTGNSMIVWGGLQGKTVAPFDDGAAYTPSAIIPWMTLPTLNAPTGRTGHTAVWTGDGMIIWGGYADVTEPIPRRVYYSSGALYAPASRRWSATTATGAPSGRTEHTAIWTGEHMIIWGGTDGDELNTGGRYSPSGRGWTALPTAGAPQARRNHTAIWDGTQMIVWGGVNGTNQLGSGARYSPSANAWSLVTPNDAPSRRTGHSAAWTGTEMLIWGGTYYDTPGQEYRWWNDVTGYVPPRTMYLYLKP